jgi:hypothetical protein
MRAENGRLAGKSSGNQARSAKMGPKTDSQAQRGLSGRRLQSRAIGFSSRRVVAVVGLFSIIAFFSFLDLVTSFVAYGQGLAEGNSMLLESSRLLGISVFNALVGSKVAFLLGVGVAAFFGARSRNVMTMRFTFTLLVTFALIFAVVSVNNLVAIGTF